MDEQPLHRVQFRLTRADRITPLLEEVVKAITPLLPVQESRHEEIAFKSRVIVSELVTNTLKHTQQKTTVLDALIYADKLCFVRRDFCAPLQFPATSAREAISWPFPAARNGEKIVVYEDDLNALQLTVTTRGATFSVIPKPAEDCNINSLHEHFGLLLICLSCDAFSYEYIPDTQENIFTTCINL